MNLIYFPNITWSGSWLSPVYANDANYAWVVHDSSSVNNYDQANDNYVRCVRGGP